MLLGTLDAKKELKTEKSVTMTVAVGQVRNDGDGNRDGVDRFET